MKLLNQKNYLLFFISQTLFSLSLLIQQIGINWLMFKLTNSTILVGILEFTTYLPILIFSVLGSTLLYKYDIDKLIFYTNLFALLIALILWLLNVMNIVKPWHLILLLFFSGCLNAVCIPSRQAKMYSMINKNIIVSASAMNILTYYIARILAPVLIFIANFYNDSLYLLVLTAIIILLLYINEVIKDKNVLKKEEKFNINYCKNIKKGLRVIAHSIKLRNIFYLCFVINLFLIPFGVLIPFLVADVLKSEEEVYSLLILLQSIGGILGALFSVYYPQKSITSTTIRGVSIMSLGILSLSITENILLTYLLMFIIGYGTSTYLSSVRAIIHNNIDESSRNITSGLIAIIFNGTPAIGALFIAFVGKYLGIPLTLKVISLISITNIIIYIIKSPVEANIYIYKLRKK